MRAIGLLVLIAAAAAAAGAEPARGAVTIGATEADFAASTTGAACPADPCALYQEGHPRGRLSAVQFDGVLVRWRIRIQSLITAQDARMRLRLVGPAVGPLLWGAEGAFINVPDAPELPRTVSQGLRMRIASGQGVAAEFENLAGGAVFVGSHEQDGATVRNIGPAPPPGQAGDGTHNETPTRLLAIAADIETDADRDGFGDETQDLCPTDGTTQGACPPADPGDVSGPGLRWCGKRRQNVLAAGALRACVRSTELAAIRARASVTVPAPGRRGGGSARIRLRAARGAAAPGSRALLDLKLRRPARVRVARALRAGRRVIARVRITGTDAAGNPATLTARVRVRRRS